MRTPTIPGPHSFWRQRAEWEATTALFVSASEALTHLWSARRIASAARPGGDWLASFTHLLDTSARALAAPLTPELERDIAPAAGDDDPLADHVSLLESMQELIVSADRSLDDPAAAIILSEQIGDLQLRLARHKTRLREIPLAQCDEASRIGDRGEAGRSVKFPEIPERGS